MNAAEFVSRLDKARPTAQGEWVACCPAHEDRSPSLAVKEADDGRILVHCFAGCETLAIVAVLGLRLADLMPPSRLGPHNGLGEPLRRLPWNPRTVLEAVAHNALAIAMTGHGIAHGKPLSKSDADLVWEMSAEIQEAMRYATR